METCSFCKKKGEKLNHEQFHSAITERKFALSKGGTYYNYFDFEMHNFYVCKSCRNLRKLQILLMIFVLCGPIFGLSTLLSDIIVLSVIFGIISIASIWVFYFGRFDFRFKKMALKARRASTPERLRIFSASEYIMLLITQK